jgi:hypothetical protein
VKRLTAKVKTTRYANVRAAWLRESRMGEPNNL